MSEVVVYVEGGGDSADQKAELRHGFDALLEGTKTRARQKRLGWKIVCAGGRAAAFDAFCNANLVKAGAIVMLLVDSEEMLAADADPARDAANRVAYLKERDGWDLSGFAPDRIHLMVPCMEAWIAADPDALARYYGQRFLRNALPVRVNLEEEPKPDLLRKLVRASTATQKGEYQKIRHASQLLQRIDPVKVAVRCPRFATFTSWLEAAIAAA